MHPLPEDMQRHESWQFHQFKCKTNTKNATRMITFGAKGDFLDRLVAIKKD